MDEASNLALPPGYSDGWFNPSRGGFPKMPSRDALPPATDTTRGQMLILRGTPDMPYMCVVDAGGGYRWLPLASGPVQRTFSQTISNSNAETTILSYTVPAGALGLSGSVEFELRGKLLNSTGGNIVVEPRVKWGGTTIFDDTSPAVASTAVVRGWVIRGRITNLGATNSQVFNGDSILSNSVATVAGIGSFSGTPLVAAAHRNSTDPAKDTTAAVALLVTMQLDTASASAVWTTDTADVYLR